MLILNPDSYTNLIRPLLFKLPAEMAQKVAEKGLRQEWLWKIFGPGFKIRNHKLNVDFCGIPLSNPLGLAAGFDKNCEMIPSLASLGFGYLTVGTVTEQPRPGNPKPRMFRNVDDSSLINALGFPGKGLVPAARRLELARSSPKGTPTVVSISGTAVDEIIRCHRRLEALVDAVEVNISSPNTAGLRFFHQLDTLAELIETINEVRYRPLIVKLPPYPAPDAPPDEVLRAKEDLLALVQVCKERGVNGLTLANTRPTPDPRLAVGIGGLSGRPIFSQMLEMVRDVRAVVGSEMAINACGGIFDGDQALAAIQAGATTIQLYTSFIYRGPTVARSVNRELLAAMSREGANLTP
jgi:dihydroorotate dehydrogenase